MMLSLKRGLLACAAVWFLTQMASALPLPAGVSDRMLITLDGSPVFDARMTETPSGAEEPLVATLPMTIGGITLGPTAVVLTEGATAEISDVIILQTTVPGQQF